MTAQFKFSAFPAWNFRDVACGAIEKSDWNCGFFEAFPKWNFRVAGCGAHDNKKSAPRAVRPGALFF